MQKRNTRVREYRDSVYARTKTRTRIHKRNTHGRVGTASPSVSRLSAG